MKTKKLILILIAGILFTSSNSMPLANAANTSLTITVPSAPRGNECTIKATLKDENGNPLQNMDIRFLICGTETIGTNRTDSNGVASLEFTLPDRLDPFETLKTGETTKTGTYKINAVFSGTTNYAQSSSEDVYIAYVFIDYTPYIVGCGILAVAIIGVVGYIGFRRRKLAKC